MSLPCMGFSPSLRCLYAIAAVGIASVGVVPATALALRVGQPSVADGGDAATLTQEVLSTAPVAATPASAGFGLAAASVLPVEPLEPPAEASSPVLLPYKEGVPALGSVPRPRVFLYEVPERYHEALVKRFRPGDRALRDDQDTTGPGPHLRDLNKTFAWTNSQIGIQRCLAHDPMRPSTPEEADFLYVPFYPSMCTVASLAPDLFEGDDAEVCTLTDYVSHILTEISRPGAEAPALRVAAEEPGMQSALEALGLERLPELWERAGGRDHIFPAAADIPLAQSDHLMGSPIRLLPDFGLIRKPDSVVNVDEYMTMFGYQQSKDVLYPWHFFREATSIPDIEVIRPHFMYFTASTKTFVSSANALRVRLAELLASQPDSLFVEMTARFPPADVQLQMSESVFCIAPPGDTQLTTRHYDAILAGCIPVILTEGAVPLPFDNVLDWSKFSILLPVSSVEDGSMLATLRSKSSEELRALRKAVYAVRPYFQITPDCTSPSGIDLFLHQLALQQRRVPELARRTPTSSSPLAPPMLQNSTGSTFTGASTSATAQSAELVPAVPASVAEIVGTLRAAAALA